MQTLPRGIRQRGQKFMVDVTVNGKRHTATVDTLDQAIVKQNIIRQAVALGKTVDQTRSNAATWSLKDALDKTLALPKPEGWRGASYAKQAELNVQSAMNFMGPERLLDTIDRELIASWLQGCEDGGNSDATLNRKMSALTKVMRVAFEYGGLPAMPKTPRLRKERVGRIRFLTDIEEAKMLQWFKLMGDTEMRDAVTVLIDTGMRRGELLNVRPADVDLKTGVIMVYGNEGKGTKNGRIRSVPMTYRVNQIMAQRTHGSTCFDLSESHMRHAWDRMREQLGMLEDKEFVLHCLRHTCASRLVKAGVSLPVIKDWLGHSNINTTMRYAHLFPQDLMNAAKALEGSR